MKGEILQNINYLEGLYAYGSGENDQLYPLLENVEEGKEFYESKIPRKIPLRFLSQTETIKSIKCGQFSTFILTNEGNVYSFGCADKGALGHEDSYSAKIVPLKFKAIGISGGDSHGIAYNEENLAFWGQFKSSEKYIGNPCYSPSYFNKSHINGESYKKVISGTNHVIILSEQKNVYTFGCNDFGQIGVAPKRVFHHFQINKLYEKNVEDIFTGDDHSFLTKYENGEKILKAWGNNRNGQLGIGSFPKNPNDNFSIYIPTKVVFPGNPNISVKKVEGGNETSICLTDDNRVFVWGLNDFSQLGLKIKDKNIPSPREIIFFNPYINPNNKIDEIYASYEFFYAKNNLTNKIYSWGMGASYILGTKKENDLDSPNLINHLFFKNLYVKDISLGNAHVVVYLTEKTEMQIKASMSESTIEEKEKEEISKTNYNKAKKRKNDGSSSDKKENEEDFSVKVKIQEEYITLDNPDQPKSSAKKIITREKIIVKEQINNNINRIIEQEKDKVKEIENEINSEIFLDSNKNSKKSNKSPNKMSKNQSKKKIQSYPKKESKTKKTEKEEVKSPLKSNRKKSSPKKDHKENEDQENSKKKNQSKSKKKIYPKDDYFEEEKIKEKTPSKSNKKKSGQKLEKDEKNSESKEKESSKNKSRSTKKISTSKEKMEEKIKDKEDKNKQRKSSRNKNAKNRDDEKESEKKEITKKNKNSKKETKKDLKEESDNDENSENNSSKRKYSYPKKNRTPEKVESRKAKTKNPKSKEKSQKKSTKSNPKKK